MAELRELVQNFDPEGDAWNPATNFGLENGREALGGYFAHVERRVQEDSLVVTEVEPLVAYVRSMGRSPGVEENLPGFRALVEREIATNGAIRIQKMSGIFTARKAE